MQPLIAVSVRVSVSEIAWVDGCGFGGSARQELVFLRLPELMDDALVTVSVRVNVSEIAWIAGCSLY